MFLQFIINGFIAGILYSLCAIGFALVYNTTRIFHIAAAALYVIAAYSLYYAYNIMNMELPLAVFFAIAVTALFSLGSEWIIYRPLYKKKSSLNVVMISSIGLMTILVNAVAMFFGNETKVIDNSIQRTYNWEDVIITTPQMYQLVVGMAVIIVFMFFIRYSRLGIQFRALSSDDVLFKALGYRVNRVRNIIFLLSGVFIALASCLTVYDVGLDPHMGMNVLINAMVAMIIGGMGRFNACILGGLLLGILQSLVVYQFASNWQNAITFLVLLFFLFRRPQGIAGYKQRTV
ncbi:branched-chain amino acid ABC transporter permease [Phocaeicola sp.]